MATSYSPNQSNLSVPTIMLIIISLMSMFFFDNALYLFCCLITAYSIILFLWQGNRPGILVFCMLMQLVQVSAYVIWMNNLGFDIDHISSHAGTAVVVSCLGLFLMSGTLYLGLRHLKMPTYKEFEEQAKLINEKKILILYLLSTSFLGGLGLALGGGGGFTQILMTLASVKWVFFIVYGYVSWLNKKNRVTLLLIVLFEFTSGLYSYFSSFKDVIFFSIILSLSFVRNVTLKQIVYGIIAGVILFSLLLTWTAVKSDYRSYLNQGKKQQVVEVSRSDAFTKLGEKVSNLTWADYQNVLSGFLYRVQYILHLAKTMDRVPELLPHEYGEVWWQNISYVLKPRLFFPDKPRFEATKKTKKYTGIMYSGFTEGASFSLGYFADSYIDFGFVGMFIPLILLSLFLVFIYRVLFRFHRINVLMRYALINVALIDFSSFESDGLFLFGRLMLMFLVFWFLSRYFLSRLQTWLYKPSTGNIWG